MFCMKCGSKVDEAARFCPNCGAPTLLGAGRDAAGETSPMQEGEASAPSASDASTAANAKPMSTDRIIAFPTEGASAKAANDLSGEIGAKTPTGKRPKRTIVIIVGAAAVVIVAAVCALFALGPFSGSSEPVYLPAKQVSYFSNGTISNEMVSQYDEYGNLISTAYIQPNSFGEDWLVNVNFRSDLQMDNKNVAVEWMYGNDQTYVESPDEAEAWLDERGVAPDGSGQIPYSMEIAYEGVAGVSRFSTETGGTVEFADGRVSTSEDRFGTTEYSYESVPGGTLETSILTYNSNQYSWESSCTETFIPDDPHAEGSRTSTLIFSQPTQVRDEDGSITTVDRQTSTGVLRFDENGCIVTVEGEDGSRTETTWVKIEKPNPLARIASGTFLLVGLTNG